MMTALLLALRLALPASAQGLADAQKRYDAGDYAGAAAGFSELLKKDPRDAALHYDLGDALFRLGRLGPAIASYQRAFDLKPRDGDIRYNLAFALKRCGEELVPPGVPPLIFTLFYWLSERELAGLQFLGAWLAMLLGAALVRFKNRREPLKPWLLGAGALWAVFVGWWGLRLSVEPSERGVIVAPTAELRSGPAATFSVSYTAPEGRRVQILSEEGGWLEVGLLKEGSRGWLPAAAVEKIEGGL